MLNSPRISCVLAVWNGETYLPESIRSIQAQTFHDWELIVVDDGSTDRTSQILDHFQREDTRIRVYHQSKQGLVASLNQGILVARGEYIARMDADDVSMPDRLTTQVEYLNRHQDIGICGSWIETFGVDTSKVVEYPCDDDAIRCQLLFASSLAHPSTMFRRKLILHHQLFYDERAVHAEDYDLWVRASQHTRFANIPAILLRYRVHPQQVGRRHESTMEESSQAIRLSQLTRLGISPAPEEAQLHHYLSRWQLESSTTFLSATRAWFDKLRDANRLHRVYPDHEFVTALGRRWSEICSSASQEGVQTALEFWRAPRLATSAWSLSQHLKFVVKCILRKDPHKKFMRMGRGTD
ncbi:MAG: glycosyltransferase [Nitrospira sp.]|nr:glycosyltransferase [Nitrospira sp.]